MGAGRVLGAGQVLGGGGRLEQRRGQPRPVRRAEPRVGFPGDPKGRTFTPCCGQTSTLRLAQGQSLPRGGPSLLSALGTHRHTHTRMHTHGHTRPSWKREPSLGAEGWRPVPGQPWLTLPRPPTLQQQEINLLKPTAPDHQALWPEQQHVGVSGLQKARAGGHAEYGGPGAWTEGPRRCW